MPWMQDPDTALIKAAMHGQSNIADVLIKRGANVNTTNKVMDI